MRNRTEIIPQAELGRSQKVGQVLALRLGLNKKVRYGSIPGVPGRGRMLFLPQEVPGLKLGVPGLRAMSFY